jgi:hypothetical protein
MDEGNVVLARLAGNHTPNLFRKGDYLHVSDLLGKCVRMVALSDRYNIDLTGEPVYDSHGVMYEIGHAVQRYTTNKLRRVKPKELYGRWSCYCGETEETTTFDKANNIECSTCKHTLTEYNELRFFNEEYKIVGSVDITLLLQNAFYFVEVKSVKKEVFQELIRPQPDHVMQATFYWWLALQNKVPVYDKVSILYINKSFEFRTPFKEFQIDPRDYVSRLSDYLEEAKALVESRKSKQNPLPAKICPNPDSPQAKKCQTCAVCFGVQ